METSARRIQFPTSLWELIDEVSEITGTSTKAILRQLAIDLEEACSKGNATMRLNPAFLTARRALKQKAADAELADIDLTVLATNRMARGTGYDGVYQHRDAFVANAREPGSGKVGRLPGRFETAEAAAWARYQHYKKYNMPYGKLEEEIEKVRGNYNLRNFGTKALPERWLKAMAIWNLGQKHIILPDLTPKERVWETNFPANDQHYGED